MKINELEVGKVYTGKNGRDVYKINEKRELFGRLANLTEAGFCETGMSYNYVILMEFEEYIPKVDWSKIKVDTKVYVRDNDYCDWRPRYFAKYENGIFYTWISGATSWSAESEQFAWKYYKLAEESEDCDD